MQHPQVLHEKFDHLQHVATGRPNARNMLHRTMLRYVTLKCCDRLAGALHRHSSAWFKLLVGKTFETETAWF